MIEIRYTLGFQSDKATAANAALFAGKDAKAAARTHWQGAREVFSQEALRAPLHEAGGEAVLARRAGVALDAAADVLFGLASTSAAGLFFVATNGYVGEVHDTNHGSSTLRGVRFATYDVEGVQGWADRLEEWPVEDVLAFVDSFEAAEKIQDERF